ncbi:MAG: 5,6-dimethylbenzimidazole synthase, partial [Planctomycetales bacterium]
AQHGQSTEHRFDESQRNGVYRAIHMRRDVRCQFTDRPISDDTLQRLLMAAHHAPSVGFMQPWNFIVVRSDKVKQQVHDVFETAHARETALFDTERREAYRDLKLEGIREAPINLCVTCDRSRHGPVVLGRTANKSTDLYSTVCAVQNLWLAARAEGIGVGWVSILDESDLKQTLGIPGDIVPVAYLCLGYVDHFPSAPDLELAGWLERLQLDDLVFHEQWGQNAESSDDKDPMSLRTVAGVEDTESDTPREPHLQRVKRITLVRHASVEENQERRFVGSTDAELAVEGRREAGQLAERLRELHFDRAWCSPLCRTRQTLDTIKAEHVLDTEFPNPEYLDELREI